jgi:hypothetical protein
VFFCSISASTDPANGADLWGFSRGKIPRRRRPAPPPFAKGDAALIAIQLQPRALTAAAEAALIAGGMLQST